MADSKRIPSPPPPPAPRRPADDAEVPPKDQAELERIRADKKQDEANKRGAATGTTTRKTMGQSIRDFLGFKKGGSVKSSASKRADGIAQRGKTKGRFI